MSAAFTTVSTNADAGDTAASAIAAAAAADVAAFSTAAAAAAAADAPSRTTIAVGAAFGAAGGAAAGSTAAAVIAAVTNDPPRKATPRRRHDCFHRVPVRGLHFGRRRRASLPQRTASPSRQLSSGGHRPAQPQSITVEGSSQQHGSRRHSCWCATTSSSAHRMPPRRQHDLAVVFKAT